MTPTEMEDAIKNLQDQADRIEQFLPNLATREELYATRDDLRSAIDDVKRYSLMLNERTGDKIKILAEGVEDVRARMATKSELKEAIDGLERRLGDSITAQIAALSRQIGALPKQRPRD